MAKLLDIPEETPLDIIMNLGSREFSCTVVIPTWTFAEKVKKREEFAALGKALEQAYADRLEKLEAEAALSKEDFVELRNSINLPSDFDGFKKFFLDNLLAFDGLRIRTKDGDKDATLMMVRKEHKLFLDVVEEFWQHDSFIYAIRDKLKQHLFQNI